MDCESETMKIPVIDLSNLKEDDAAWESTKSHVREALQEFGCFKARFDDIPHHLQESVVNAVQPLFDLPLEIKLQNKGMIPTQGYHQQSPAQPLCQSFVIDDVLSPGKIDTYVSDLWPQGNPTFSKNIHTYLEKLSELDKLVRMMVLQSFGLENYLKVHLDSTHYVARIHKYDPPRSHKAELGISSHSDKNMTTILHQLNNVGGFEFLTKSGQWIDVQPSPNSYIVLVGDSLSAWTNGRLHPPLHRVTMTGEEDRYSIGLFSIPNSGYIIEAPKEMVDKEHPLLFKPFDHDEYLEFFFSKAGQASPDAFKEYCGA